VTVKASDLRRLINEQGYRCALTGWELTPDVASCDHKVPVSEGGKHGVGNIHIVHTLVNRAKGTMTQEEFIRVCCAVADHARREPQSMDSEYERGETVKTWGPLRATP
jgi:hypothetical protein